MHDSLYFSDHHPQVREMVRDFAKNVVKPTARQYDLDSRFPWDNVKQMAELGLFGIPWPEELGGSGMDYLSYITVIHELAKVDASHAIRERAYDPRHVAHRGLRHRRAKEGLRPAPRRRPRARGLRTHGA